MARCGYCGIDHRRFTMKHAVGLILHRQTIQTLSLLSEMRRFMTALENLQAADAALKDEIVTFLADIAGRLGGSDDPAIQSVADDINAQVAALQANDPGPVPVPVDTGVEVPGDTDTTDTPAQPGNGDAPIQ